MNQYVESRYQPLILGLALGALITWFLSFLLSKDEAPKPSENEAVFIVNEQPRLAPILAELLKLFDGTGFAGIILIDKEGRFQGFSSDGSPVDFCEPDSHDRLAGINIDVLAAARQCTKQTSVRSIAKKVNNCGTCTTTDGDSVRCNKSNDKYSGTNPDICPGTGTKNCNNNCS